MSVGAVSFREAVRVWARIGLLSFGGPAGQVALMHEELVERRRWIDEERFLHALNYCMLLPGPEAQQLATYIGWLMHGARGGLAAGALFVLPGFVAILALSALYASFHQLPAVAAVFFGLKAAVLAIVVEAVRRVGKRALRNRLLVAISALAFVAIFFFDVPYPAVVVGAGAFGFVAGRARPAWFPSGAKQAQGDAGADTVVGGLAATGGLAHTRPSARRAARVAVVGAAVWLGPVAALVAAFGRASVFVREGAFFAKAAVVTFGGAYAVLGYIAQRAVETYGWLRPGEMLDGLGLAETTPGPLIMVVQFVGFLGAHRAGAPLPPMLAGVLGSLVTVWVTFVPCFVWIFLGGPYIERLRGHRALGAALSAITAAVVGVIVNLSLWFALHVVFHRVDARVVGPLRLWVPAPATIDVAALALSALAMLAIFRFKLGLPKTLAGAAVLGASIRLLF
ncbi:MAG TPA: chromate efflux transporter [Polyangia bacterium]|nr:chromate efflux transporter [Polyangia bacterium]